MKLLVSTRRTQGQRADDFCFVPEGELLRFGLEHTACSDSCGCGRAMFGMQSRTGTTTMLVADLPISEESLAGSIVAAYEVAWMPLDAEAAEPLAQDLILAAMPFEVGDVIERNGLTFRLRP